MVLAGPAVPKLLEEGGKVTLEYDPGQSGTCDEQGDVIDPPVEGGFVATALDWQDAVIGYGGGDTVAGAPAAGPPQAVVPGADGKRHLQQ